MHPLWVCVMASETDLEAAVNVHSDCTWNTFRYNDDLEEQPHYLILETLTQSDLSK